MAFKKRYGKNEDGSYSECKAKPGNEGKYGCFHTEHVMMTPTEAQAANEREAEQKAASVEQNTSLSKPAVSADEQKTYKGYIDRIGVDIRENNDLTAKIDRQIRGIDGEQVDIEELASTTDEQIENKYPIPYSDDEIEEKRHALRAADERLQKLYLDRDVRTAEELDRNIKALQEQIDSCAKSRDEFYTAHTTSEDRAANFVKDDENSVRSYLDPYMAIDYLDSIGRTNSYKLNAINDPKNNVERMEAYEYNGKQRVKIFYTTPAGKTYYATFPESMVDYTGSISKRLRLGNRQEDMEVYRNRIKTRLRKREAGTDAMFDDGYSIYSGLCKLSFADDTTPTYCRPDASEVKALKDARLDRRRSAGELNRVVKEQEDSKSWQRAVRARRDEARSRLKYLELAKTATPLDSHSASYYHDGPAFTDEDRAFFKTKREILESIGRDDYSSQEVDVIGMDKSNGNVFLKLHTDRFYQFSEDPRVYHRGDPTHRIVVDKNGFKIAEL